MIDIEFSIMGTPPDAEAFKSWLDEFEHQFHIRVKLTVLDWQEGWSQLVKTALYSHGPDVSEIGSTWIGSLASMNSLRPFSPMDIRSVGGADNFLPDAWNSSRLPGDNQVWALPWLADTQVIYYRKDWLENAGIAGDETSIKQVFSTHEQMVNTLKQLKEHGYSTPLALYVNRENNNLHNAAPWVWTNGGDFVDPEGKRVLFDQAEAMRGFKKYFELKEFLAPQEMALTPPSSQFIQGQVGVCINNPGDYMTTISRDPELLKIFGIVKVPGVPFVGGTNLVIWKYTRQPGAAMELIRFLTRKSENFRASPHGSRLPTRKDALAKIAESGNPYEKAMLDSLAHGRAYRTVRLWGLVEDNLITAISHIWEGLLSDPDLDINQSVEDYLPTLARRLNISLGN